MASERCTLLSASCTTGWNDWIHGELWLCPAGLLRRALGLRETLRHGPPPTLDTTARPVRSFTRDDIVAITTANKRNQWIPWESIAIAEATRGPLTDSLHITLQRGRKIKFLWYRMDYAFDLVTRAAADNLAGRLVTK